MSRGGKARVKVQKAKPQGKAQEVCRIFINRGYPRHKFPRWTRIFWATEGTEDTEKESIVDNQLVGSEGGQRAGLGRCTRAHLINLFKERNPQKTNAVF